MMNRALLFISFPLAAAVAFAEPSPSPAPSAARFAAPAGASLYERLGGRKGIENWVSVHVDMLLRDKRLQTNVALNNAYKKTNADKMKASMVEWFCEKTGGPGHYPGRSLTDIHARMDISDEDWKYMLETVSAALAKFKVADADKQAVYDLMTRYKAEVLTR